MTLYIYAIIITFFISFIESIRIKKINFFFFLNFFINISYIASCQDVVDTAFLKLNNPNYIEPPSNKALLKKEMAFNSHLNFIIQEKKTLKIVENSLNYVIFEDAFCLDQIFNVNIKIFDKLQEIDNNISYLVKKDYNLKYLLVFKHQKTFSKIDFINYLNNKYANISELSKINRNCFIKVCEKYCYIQIVYDILIEFGIPSDVCRNLTSFSVNDYPINNPTEVSNYLSEFLIYQTYYNSKLKSIKNDVIEDRNYFHKKQPILYDYHPSYLKNNMLMFYKKYK